MIMMTMSMINDHCDDDDDDFHCILIYCDFSKNALVTLRNGSLYLICRIADLRYLDNNDDDDDDYGDDDDDGVDDDDDSLYSVILFL